LENELNEYRRQLREKEQENRISMMKIKMHRNTIRSSKLKPMAVEEKKEGGIKKEGSNKFRSQSKPSVAKTNIGTSQMKKSPPIEKQVPKPPPVKKEEGKIMSFHFISMLFNFIDCLIVGLYMNDSEFTFFVFDFHLKIVSSLIL